MRIPFPFRRVVSGSLATLSIGALLVLPGGRLDAQAVPAGGQPAARAGGQPARQASSVRLPIHGVVVDAQSGAPIDYASVELEGEYRSTATTAEGAFTFRRLRPGGYVLVVRQLGYREHRQYVPLHDTTASLRVALSPEPLVLEALRVTYSRFEQRSRSAPVSVRVLNRRDLATTANAHARQLVPTRKQLQTPTGGGSSAMRARAAP
jgi:hypothetical protein